MRGDNVMWIETENGNRISENAQMVQSHKIQLKGNITIESGVVLNGEINLVDDSPYSIMIGKYSYIGSNSEIHVPMVEKTGEMTVYCPSSIGSYTIVGPNCKLNSLSIGNRVIIESDCTINDLVVIYDCCIIRKGCVVPPKTIIPPYSEVSGFPGKGFKICDLNGGYKKSNEMRAKQMQIVGSRSEPSQGLSSINTM